MNRFVYWIIIYLPNKFTVTIDMRFLSRGQAVFKITLFHLYTVLEIDFVGFKCLICDQKIRWKYIIFEQFGEGEYVPNWIYINALGK